MVAASFLVNVINPFSKKSRRRQWLDFRQSVNALAA